jgi:hypothetical protein
MALISTAPWDSQSLSCEHVESAQNQTYSEAHSCYQNVVESLLPPYYLTKRLAS